jgi:hypothetical protein
MYLSRVEIILKDLVEWQLYRIEKSSYKSILLNIILEITYIIINFHIMNTVSISNVTLTLA